MAMIDNAPQLTSPIAELEDDEYAELLHRMVDGDAEALEQLLGLA